jgi:hypothetical protein
MESHTNALPLSPDTLRTAQSLIFITVVIVVVLTAQPSPAVGTTCATLVLVAAQAYRRLANRQP